MKHGFAKKIPALLLALIIAFSAFSCAAYAAGEQPKAKGEEKPVARMYFCATNTIGVGHSWIYIKNLTSKPITVGHMTVRAKDGVTISNLGFTHIDGPGTFYNYEAYRYHDKLPATSYITCDLTAARLENVSNTIKNSNFYELVTYNCGGLTTAVWNAGSDRKLIYFPLTFVIMLQMTGAQKNPEMNHAAKTDVYKQHMNGTITVAKEFN